MKAVERSYERAMQEILQERKERPESEWVLTYVPENRALAAKDLSSDDLLQLDEIAKRICSKFPHVQPFLADRGLSEAYHIWLSGLYGSVHLEGDLQVVSDIVWKFSRSGKITVKQQDYLYVLLERIHRANEWREKAKKEASEAEPLPIPEGSDSVRTFVSGEVVSVKDKGWGWKMLVRADEGWKAYGSLPKAICDAKPGDYVRFAATLKPSGNDPAFGFYSRPTQAQFLHREE